MSQTPSAMFTTGQSIRAAVGTSVWWNVPSPLGVCLLLLALFPTDARAIRVVCSTCLVLHVHGAWAARTRRSTRGRPARSTRLPKCCVVPRCRHRARTHALRCGGYRAMQPRFALSQDFRNSQKNLRPARIKKKIRKWQALPKKIRDFWQFCSNFGVGLVILGHIFFVDFYFGGSGILTIGN